MNVQILDLGRNNYFEVNGKIVYKSIYGKWIATLPLAAEELVFFKQYMKIIQGIQI